MMIFAVNFNIYFMILIGQFLKAIRSEELICMFIIFFVAVAAVTIDLSVRHTYDNVGDALRYSSFNIASVMSTTGFGTADFTGWSTLSQVILLAVMMIGGSAGSTSGGMKVSRLMIISKSSMINLKKTLSPRSVYSLKMDKKPVDESTISSVQSFFILYILLIALSTILVSIENPTFSGNIFESNFSAVISCFNNIGPGIGAVGPSGNFAGYSEFSKIVLSLDMLLGRLEILPIMLMLSPRSWKRI